MIASSNASGSGAVSGTTGGMTATAGAGGASAHAGAGGVSGAPGSKAGSGGMGAAGSAAGSHAGSGGSSGAAGGNGSSITGMLGALGAVQPIMAGFAITTATAETAIYLSSAPLTCPQISTPGGRWLGSLPAGTQVIEIVVAGAATAKSYTVGGLGGAELNYAAGGMSSSTEKHSSAGSITFTKASTGGVHEGSLMGTNVSGMIMGSFHAEWCQGGQEY